MRPITEGMSQDPKLTVGWALAGLEHAIRKLPEGAAERRVRAQFHQLLLAFERDRQATNADALIALFANDDYSLRN